jgi:radical SAM superfamily enzyme YgiQ (UPF0313 family)
LTIGPGYYIKTITKMALCSLRKEKGLQRILLVKPSILDVSVGFSSLARVEPLDLEMVAASVPDDTCRIVDMRLEPDGAFERVVGEFRPDIVGLTAFTSEAGAAKALAQRAKRVNPDVTTVWGGAHATMNVEDALSEQAIDVVVRGEGEITFPELTRAIAQEGPLERIPGIAFRTNSHLVVTSNRELISDLDNLPFPDRSLVKDYLSRYYLSVMGKVGVVETTRGCPNSCDFCSVPQFQGGKYRRKSPRRVLKELARLPGGFQTVAFVDDELWADAHRAEEIAQLIAERDRAGWEGRDWKYWAQVSVGSIVRHPELMRLWAQIGLKVLLVGIESLDEGELAQHGKKTNVAQAVEALGIMRSRAVEAWGCFIINPGWGRSQFELLKKFVIGHGIALPQFTVLTPLPGTELTRRLEAGGFRLADVPAQLLDFLHAALPTQLRLEEFYGEFARLYRETGIAIPENYLRAVRSGVVSRGWLRSEAGRRAASLFANLGRPETYMRAHR